MSDANRCCSLPIIPNQIRHTWITSASQTPVYPYTSDQIAAITGYILNNGSSKGPVTVLFFRGGMLAVPLPFRMAVKVGEYQSFTVLGVDTIQISTTAGIATGEINLNVNFNPF